jgi:hypothetical protein
MKIKREMESKRVKLMQKAGVPVYKQSKMVRSKYGRIAGKVGNIYTYICFFGAGW